MQIPKLITLAEETAAHLGDGWSYKPGSTGQSSRDGATIEHPDGRAVTVWAIYSGQRYGARGVYPQPHQINAFHLPMVTVDGRRGARALASAIRHRLLPRYEPLRQEAARQAAPHLAAAAQAHAEAAELAAMLPGGRLVSRDCVWFNLPPHGHGVISVRRPGVADVRIDYAPTALLRVLAEAAQAEPAPEAGRRGNHSNGLQPGLDPPS